MLHAIYASTSGNVEIVVEKVAELWRQQGLAVELHRAEQTSPEVIAQADLFLLATSTWEHGVLNPFFQPLHKAMSTMDCHGKKALFIGLGDTRYEPVLFCEGVETLRRTWLAQGGEQLGVTMKVNGEPYHVLNTSVKTWAERMATLITSSQKEATV